MTLFDQISQDIADAMKRKDQARLAPLRMLKTALVNRKVEKGRDLDAVEERQIVGTLVKQRRDSIEQYRSAGREELAEREEAEIVVLGAYLPPAADSETIEAAVTRALAETGAVSVKDMGRVMKAAMTILSGSTVDGRAVSEVVKQRLSDRAR
jgi:uncharacterized protein YqeY